MIKRALGFSEIKLRDSTRRKTSLSVVDSLFNDKGKSIRKIPSENGKTILEVRDCGFVYFSLVNNEEVDDFDTEPSIKKAKLSTSENGTKSVLTNKTTKKILTSPFIKDKQNVALIGRRSKEQRMSASSCKQFAKNKRTGSPAVVSILRKETKSPNAKSKPNKTTKEKQNAATSGHKSRKDKVSSAKGSRDTHGKQNAAKVVAKPRSRSKQLAVLYGPTMTDKDESGGESRSPSVKPKRPSSRASKVTKSGVCSPKLKQRPAVSRKGSLSPEKERQTSKSKQKTVSKKQNPTLAAKKK